MPFDAPLSGPIWLVRAAEISSETSLRMSFRVTFSREALSEWSASMLAQPDPQKKSAFKNPYVYSWTVLALAALVVSWILFSRWQENRSLEKRAKEERAQKQQEQDRAALEQFGGKELAT